MEFFVGEFASRHGHEDISIGVDHIYADSARDLIAYFEDEITNGKSFRDNETVQVGWTLLLLKGNGSNLEVMEPDFSSMPIQWVKGANNTFRHMMLQREICAQVGTDVAFPSIRQAGIVSPSFLERHGEFEMSRDVATGNDSGWVFRDLNYKGSEGAYCSLYQIASIVPAIIPLIALPSGAIVRRSDSDLDITVANSNASSRTSDFLSRLIQSPYFS